MKFERIRIFGLALGALLLAPMLLNIARAQPVRCAGCKTEYFLIQHLAAPYKAVSGVEILPGKSGNKVAIKLLAKGTINFAFTCHPHGKLAGKLDLDPAVTANWVSTAIAKDPIVVVAHPGCGVTDLSLEQLRRVFSGAVRNWSEVGGADRAITVGYLDESVASGVVTVFQETALGPVAEFPPQARKAPSPTRLGSFTKGTPGAVSFMGLNSYDERCGTLISIDGVSPETANVVNGSYPLSVTYYLAYDPTRSNEAEGFLAFCATGQGQDLINEIMVAIPQKNIVIP